MMRLFDQVEVFDLIVIILMRMTSYLCFMINMNFLVYHLSKIFVKTGLVSDDDQDNKFDILWNISVEITEQHGRLTWKQTYMLWL